MDARGRAIFAGVLILDNSKGMLDQITERTYPEQTRQHPESGEEILAIARTLQSELGEEMTAAARRM